MTSAGDGPVVLRAALQRLLGSLDVPPPDLLSVLFQRWEEVVGVELARHCKPVSVDGDRLVVQASDPAWASEVQWLASTVVERINEVSKTARLRSLTVRVARSPG